MPIKLKLLFSYIAAVFVPLILSVIAAIVLAGALYGSDNSKEDFFDNYAMKVPRAYVDLKNLAEVNPDKLKDETYLTEMDSELKLVNTGIVVVDSNGNELFVSKKLKKAGLSSLLKNFGENNRYREDRIQSKGLLTILDKEVKFSNGQTGRVYLISDMRPVGIFLGRYFSSLGIIVFIILIVTNVLLTFLISTGITKQLKRLKHATEQIKDGNLNFELKTRSRDEIGDVSRAFEQMRSKLKESIDKQLQIEENRKELISSISHDLKTPVTSIKGYVEGIMDGVADSPEKMDKYIKTIYAKANDLDRLIDDLFLFSKLDLKKVPFNFEKVDLVKYFNDCIEELRIDLDKKAIKLEFENNCAENVTVMADREKLKRVIVNIIQNAVKYMDKEEKTINVNVSCSGNEALVRIRDNGQGIKEEELQFIFDRFFRTDASRNSSTGGSGLGLSITKQIIEGHEGKIWAESEYGKQTTIAFTLKIVQ